MSQKKTRATQKSAGSDNNEYCYNNEVKKRLIDWKNKFEKDMNVTLNYSAIAEQMEKSFAISTTATKIGAMFDITKDRTIQLQEIMALAYMFNIPVLDICAHQQAATEKIDLNNLIRKQGDKSSALRQLDNQLYKGEYWAYYFKPKHIEGQVTPVKDIPIEEARLNIEIDTGRTSVTLEEKKTSKKFDGSLMPSFELGGILYNFDNTDIAYCLLSDSENRKAMALMFDYYNLTADIRYYISAGMMTFSQSQIHHPLFQKMAIFRKRLPYTEVDVANRLRGILSLNSSPIVIDINTCDEMIKENPVWEKALSKEKTIKECRVFSEVSVRDCLNDVTDESIKTALLLELRKNSLLPAHELVSETDRFADYIKEFQLMHAIDKKDIS